MLSEAVLSSFFAGNPGQMIETAQRAVRRLGAGGSIRARFMATMVAGMASILGGDAEAGADSIHEAVALAESSLDVRDDPRLLPWLVLGPLFLRESAAGRSLIERALHDARARAAFGRPAAPARPSWLATRPPATCGSWRDATLHRGDRACAGDAGSRAWPCSASEASPGWRPAADVRRSAVRMPPRPCRSRGRSASACTRSGPRLPSESWSSVWARPPRPPHSSSTSRR